MPALTFDAVSVAEEAIAALTKIKQIMECADDAVDASSAQPGCSAYLTDGPAIAVTGLT